MGSMRSRREILTSVAGAAAAGTEASVSVMFELQGETRPLRGKAFHEMDRTDPLLQRRKAEVFLLHLFLSARVLFSLVIDHDCLVLPSGASLLSPPRNTRIVYPSG
jgi:hypothetical protein